MIRDIGIIKPAPKIEVSIFSIIVLGLFFSCRPSIYTMIILATVLLHELAHLFFLKLFGAEITKTVFYPFGIDIIADTLHLSYKKEAVCTLAGCAVNLTASAAALIIMHFCPSAALLFFFLCNGFLGLFNLIPLSVLDGGKALRLLLYDNLDIDRAFYIMCIIDTLSSIILLGFCFTVLAFSHCNLSVIAAVLYLCLAVLTAFLTAKRTSFLEIS